MLRSVRTTTGKQNFAMTIIVRVLYASMDHFTFALVLWNGDNPFEGNVTDSRGLTIPISISIKRNLFARVFEAFRVPIVQGQKQENVLAVIWKSDIGLTSLTSKILLKKPFHEKFNLTNWNDHYGENAELKRYY